MIGRKSKRDGKVEPVEPVWFDDFDLRLGDVMRGERATMGKSLLDVQRELRIRASYIAAIENCDPSAFDTPGFIAGYVRSYARYLNMDPDRAFAAFCAESGFSTAHGMSAAASTIRKEGEAAPALKPSAPKTSGKFGSGLGAGLGGGKSDAKRRQADTAPIYDPFARSSIGFQPVGDGFLSHVEPRAVGSLLVLLALIGGLGFGGWTVLNEVQRVQVTPVEHTPTVLAELDPLDAAGTPVEASAGDRDPAAVTRSAAGVFNPPSDAMDRLYRPQALEVPVMVARDAPISTLDPGTVGTFAQVETAAEPAVQEQRDVPEFTAPQVMEEAPEGIVLFAVRPAWVRVRAADGSIIFEKILEAGEEYTLPQEVEAPTLQAGMSGSLYFEIDGELYGPAGQGTATVRQLSMARADLLAGYQPADLAQDPELAKIIALADASQIEQPQE